MNGTLPAFRALLLVFVFMFISACAVLSKSEDVITAAQIDPTNPVTAIGQVYAVSDAVSVTAEHSLRTNRITSDQAAEVLQSVDRALNLADTAGVILNKDPEGAEQKLERAQSVLLGLEAYLEEKVDEDD